MSEIDLKKFEDALYGLFEETREQMKHLVYNFVILETKINKLRDEFNDIEIKLKSAEKEAKKK